MGQGSDTVAVGQIDVGAMGDQQVDDLLVARPTIGEDDRL
jgi:hypothetical protein